MLDGLNLRVPDGERFLRNAWKQGDKVGLDGVQAGRAKVGVKEVRADKGSARLFRDGHRCSTAAEYVGDEIAWHRVEEDRAAGQCFGELGGVSGAFLVVVAQVADAPDVGGVGAIGVAAELAAV